MLLAAGITVALAVPSQAGINAPLSIAKVVIGTPDPAATFTVNYSCTGNQTST